MLQGILVILLFIIIFIAIVAMIVVRFVYRGINRLRDAARSAMGMDTDDMTGGGDRGRRSAYSRGYGSSGNHSRNSSSGHTRRTQTTAGTTIIDNRSPEYANRKIFAEGEGEYVDFEEKP